MSVVMSYDNEIELIRFLAAFLIINLPS